MIANGPRRRASAQSGQSGAPSPRRCTLWLRRGGAAAPVAGGHYVVLALLLIELGLLVAAWRAGEV
jgi:hypothetical protein